MAKWQVPAVVEELLYTSRYVLSEITSEKYPFYGKIKKCYSASPDRGTFHRSRHIDPGQESAIGFLAPGPRKDHVPIILFLRQALCQVCKKGSI